MWYTARMSTITPAADEATLRIEMRDLASLRPHPQNYNRHSSDQIARLGQSLRDHGQVKNVVITSDGTILAGHGLVEAAQSIGWTRIACGVYAGDHPESYIVADNYLATLAEPDEGALASLLQDLQGRGELPASGYSDAGLKDLLAGLRTREMKRREEKEVPEVQQGPTRVQAGEVWALGRHRVMCGDATDPANWQRLMAGELAHAVVTDPPSGINYVGGRAAQEERISAHRRGADGQEPDAYWDDLTPEQYRALLVGSLGLAHQHSDDKAPLYLWFASTHLRHVLDCLAETGWQERNLLVWVKNNGAGALFAQYKHWYEPCFYAFKRGQAPRWHGPTNERTVWEHDKPLANDLHPTMKPLALIERTISNATELGHLVVDAFLGSGTAIMAAERTGRRCFGFDLDAHYCDVILARWEGLTGEKAECD